MTLCLLGLKRKWKIIRSGAFPITSAVFHFTCCIHSLHNDQNNLCSSRNALWNMISGPLRPLGETPVETVASEVTPALTELIHKSIIQWTGGRKKMSTDYGLLRRHMWRLRGEWRSSHVSVRMNLHLCLKAKSISNALQKWALSSRFMPLKTFIPLSRTWVLFHFQFWYFSKNILLQFRSMKYCWIWVHGNTHSCLLVPYGWHGFKQNSFRWY